MANRQSLKDLQERLAKRLSAAKTQAITASWLAVEVGGQKCLFGAGTATGSDRVSSESRLVSLHSALGVNAVLWVDRLLGLRNPSTFTALGVRPPDAPPYLARSLIDRDGQTWQELDLQVLAAEPEFLAIAA